MDDKTEERLVQHNNKPHLLSVQLASERVSILWHGYWLLLGSVPAGAAFLKYGALREAKIWCPQVDLLNCGSCEFFTPSAQLPV